MRLYAGFDGGGSHTRCALADEDGKLLGRGVGGPSNILYCGLETGRASIAACLAGAFSEAGMEPAPLDGACVCSASVEMHEGEHHLPYLRDIVPAEALLCESDAACVRFAGARNGDATVLISGTGAVAYACRGGAYKKADGWGALLGDEGSGYAIGLSLLRAAMRVADGRERDEALLRAVFERFDIPMDKPKKLRVVLEEGATRVLVASVASLVFDLEAGGSEIAARILDKAASSLCETAVTAARGADFDKKAPLLTSGGLLRPEASLYRRVARLAEKSGAFSRVSPPCAAMEVVSAAMALSMRGLANACEELLNCEEANV